MNNEMTSNPNFKNERTSFGKICRYSLIGFNILIILWLIDIISSVISGFVNGNYMTGGEIDPILGIGLTISVVFFVGVFVVGNVILGLMTFFTRPKKRS